MLNRLTAALIALLLIHGLRPAHADNVADAVRIMNAATNRMHALTSLTADVSIADGPTHGSGFVKCMKPNYFQVGLWTTVSKLPTTAHAVWDSDGKIYYTVSDSGVVTSSDASLMAASFDQEFWLSLFTDFFKPEPLTTAQMGAMGSNSIRIRHVRERGRMNRVIDAASTAENMPVHIHMVIGPEGLLDQASFSAPGTRQVVTLTNIRIDPPLTRADFAFHTPPFAQKPTASTPTPAPSLKGRESKVDPVARAILLRSERAYKLLHAITVDTVEVEHSYYPQQKRAIYDRHDDTLRLMRPNYAFLDSYATEFSVKLDKFVRTHSETLDSDGNVLWTLSNFEKNYYQKDAPGPAGANITLLGDGGLLDGFFRTHPGLATTADTNPQVQSVKYLGKERWQGDLYDVLRITFNPVATISSFSITEYVGADNILHRMEADSASLDGSTYNLTAYIDSLQMNPSLTASDFAFTLPQGAILKIKPVIAATPPPAPVLPLIANGAQAPNFTVHDRKGNTVTLSDYKGKVVVLDFWATWCEPCQMSLPSTNAVAERFRNQNVEVLGVNVWDTEDAFNAWLPDHKSFYAIKFAIDPTPDEKDVASALYHVSGIPTQFIIDPAGKIVHSIVGFPGDDSELVGAIRKSLAER
jgi:thiol-disulfide isomerase/thioredoxin